MRHYEVLVILDPSLDERTVRPSLETFLNVVKNDGGTIEKIEVWGKRRLAYEILKNAEGIYALLEVACEPATVPELDGGAAHQGPAPRADAGPGARGRRELRRRRWPARPSSPWSAT